MGRRASVLFRIAFRRCAASCCRLWVWSPGPKKVLGIATAREPGVHCAACPVAEKGEITSSADKACRRHLFPRGFSSVPPSSLSPTTQRRNPRTNLHVGHEAMRLQHSDDEQAPDAHDTATTETMNVTSTRTTPAKTMTTNQEQEQEQDPAEAPDS
ncbi:hypothetical protein ACJZ2D_005777 [Fusarium nematophilum]